MELPQHRPFGAEGRKPTHDFLSLYSHSTAQQDPVPPCQDNYLKTHDFLQPLERMGRTNSTKEEEADGLAVVAAAPPSVEHLLPGGIGTYTISHVSNFTQRALRPEGSIFPTAQSSTRHRNYDNSICSSYGSGFTLWEESAAKTGKTGKENMAQEAGAGESGSKSPKRTPSERPPQSSSNNILNRHSSQSAAQTAGQKNQSFIEIMKSAKVYIQEETVDDVQEFFIKTESETTQKGELSGKMDGKSTEQRPNTPRSKHSATEQRRRSKINDRFQMLRQLIPHSDQKRDKASFLLEVIEYIHFLQEKVHKYEGSFRGWRSEPEKMIPWINNPRPEQNLDDQSVGVKIGSSSDLFAANNDENNTITSLALPSNLRKPMESEARAATSYFGSDQNTGTINKDSNSASDNIKAKGLTMEGGTINISSVYSQGLLSTLTQALQGCGVDLSQASVSVQIEVGKQANIRRSLQQLSQKEIDIPASNQEVSRSRIASSEESDRPSKKLKRDRS